MAAKYQDIAELYVDMGHQVTGDPTAWVGFLAAACRNYKCSFDEQLLIYAQRPDATAVTTLETWNRRFHRWVNAGSKGIAVLANDGQRNYLKYYFDVSDTHAGINARPVSIWQMDERYEKAISEQLIDSFGEVTSDEFGDVLLQSAENVATAYGGDYLPQLVDSINGSLLEEMSVDECYVAFHQLLSNSVAYMLLTRCGVDPTAYLDPSDFFDIVNFNTTSTLNVIGTASSDLSEMLLREVSQTIRTVAQREATRYDEEKQPERSNLHERDHLHEAGRLPYPEPHITEAARSSAWEIRTDAPPILAEVPKSDIHNATDQLSIDAAPVRDRTDGAESTKSDRNEASSREQRDGAAQSERSDEVDAVDEQLPTAGRGGDSEQPDLQLTLFPSETQQREAIEADDFTEIDEVTTVLRELEQIGLTGGVALDIDFSGGLVVTPKEFQSIVWTDGDFLTEQDIDRVFQSGSGFENGKLRIMTLYEQEQSKVNRAKLLKKEYGTGGRSFTFSNETRGFINYNSKGISVDSYALHQHQKFSWKQAEERIHFLITSDRYLTESEKQAYAAMQQKEENSIPQSEPAHDSEPVIFMEPQTANYRITDDALGEGGPKLKYARNVAAIHVLQQLEQENRKPTKQEQQILANYVGWGGLPMAFDETNISWSEEYKNLKMLLPEDQYAAARASTLTAFYTPPVVIRAVYEALGNLDFEQGNILEPACGTGNFFGMLPDSMKDSNLYGIELDPLTGAIAKQLYPDAKIAIQGFEQSKLPDNYFDVVLGNVPFGDFKVDDARYNSENFLIHDYFFAKALDKVCPGGVVAFITSKGTMDKKDPSVRRYLAQRAELLGAIRLPEDTFRANAGTEVTSDILFLQKRERIIEVEPDWVYLDTTENGITMNHYFVEHPEMICGEMVLENGRFGMETTCKAKPDTALADVLHEAIQHITGTIPEYQHEIDEVIDVPPATIDADPEVRNFSYALVDDRLCFREDGVMKPVSLSQTAESRVKSLVEIRDCVRRLIRYQTEDYPESTIQAEQQQLNRLYDAFTEKHGLINSRGNNMAFAADESYYLLCSLEILDEKGNLERKADMFTKRTIRPHRAVASVETSSEALAVSIGEKARVDLPYMQQLTGKPQEEIIQELRGVIYRVPAVEPEQYVTADEYLSGNVREKLRIAELAAKVDPSYQIHVESLQQVIPQDLSAAEISVRLGTTWIPQEDIQQFVIELLEPTWYMEGKIKVRYSSITGDWNVEGKSVDRDNVRANSTYGTNRASAYRLIEDSLNLRDTRIFDYVLDDNGNKKAVLNQKDTMAAQAKQERIGQEFRDWIWKDPERRNRLVRYYNDTFNAVRPREYDGSHIVFSGMNPEITLRPHQVNAIAHILYGGNTLLAHVVGAGKSFEMIAAAQESKRLGLCQKSMFVVPNHLVGQWAAEYLRLYPSANILVTTKKDFQTANRKKFCSRIATGEYDAVIIGHSQFEKIPMSAERQRRQLEQQIEEIKEGIREAKEAKSERFTIKQMERTKKSIEAKLKKLNSTERKDNVICFEELGIDRLFVDESHFYKNLFLFTKMRNVGGIAQTEAQKSSDLFLKCRYLDEITGGRGVVFATGTPIANSMVEMYSVQRYLQYGTLVRNGLQHFDAWASIFGETITALELAPEGTKYRSKTRFAKFYNLPELMQMFREVADIQTADMLHLPVPKVIYRNVKTEPSEIQLQMVAKLAKRADTVRAGNVDASIDNMLLITNDGRKLALDQRMIDSNLPDDSNSKVNACVENVFRIWNENHDTKAAQMIFSDLSTPKGDGSFNVYDDIRQKLQARGIPKEQIAYIHEAPTDAKKQELFAKVRSGEVRILLGSTQKMGAGTNVQTRLIALHNLDCPWRPSDLAQRQGRIERQGNLFPEVEVFRYVTEKTFDAYLYQLVESKQKFISQIMTSKSPVRSAEDVDEVALSFAEVKMLATGDTRIKEKMDLEIQVSKLRVLKQSYLNEHYSLEDRVLQRYPKLISEYFQRISACEADISLAEQHPLDDKKFSPMVLNGISYTDKAVAGEMLLSLCKMNAGSQGVEIGSYRGFKMELNYEPFGAEFQLYLCGAMKHKVSLGSDALGNLTRIENEIAKFPKELEAYQAGLTDTQKQLADAKAELQQPFAQEEELKQKEERLTELNIELNLDKHDAPVLVDEPEQEEVNRVKKYTNWER